MQRDNGARPKRISLVAGGAGFLGSHLVERLLSEGRRVICVDSFLSGTSDNIARFAAHPGFRLVRQDIQRPLTVEGEEIDEVYNFACAASPPRYQADPHHTMMTSVIGTSNLLALAAARGARFLQASTSEIYGDPEVHPQTEDYVGSVNCTGPRACYDEGKRGAETLFYEYAHRFGVETRIARILNTYGPRMDAEDGRVVSNFVVQALCGRDITIYGTGQQTRSFCYVDDLIEGLIRLMGQDHGVIGPVNLGNPREFTVLDLAQMVLAKTQSCSKLRYLDALPDDPRQRRPDITRAHMVLGWQPTISLTDGLDRVIAHFADALGAPKAAVLS